jgi:AbiV family abortive infection protein
VEYVEFYPDETQSELLHAILQNAHDLVIDAETLLERGRWARAHALATLAMEEAGKAWLTHGHLQQAWSDPLPKHPWRHQQKLEAARQMAAFAGMVEAGVGDLVALYAEEHTQLAEDDFFTRMTALYVDLRDGEVIGGSTAISQDRAQETCSLARPVVRAAMTLMWPSFVSTSVEN